MDNNIRTLLQLIKADADISFLLKSDLTYSQIAVIFGEVIKQGLVSYADTAEGSPTKIVVTGKGEAWLAENAARLQLGSQARWISQDGRHLRTKSEIDDIFLPRKKDSFF